MHSRAQRSGRPVSLANTRIGTCTLGDGVNPCRSKVDNRCIHAPSGGVGPYRSPTRESERVRLAMGLSRVARK